MNCTEFQNHLDDFLANETSEITTKACQIHLEDCVSCMKKMLQTRDLIKELKKRDAMPSAAITAEQEKAIWQATWNDSKASSTPTKLIKYGSIAASLLVILTFLPYQLYTNTETHKITFAAFEEKAVYLVFNSDTALEDAVFTINIPDNYDYAGNNKNKLITWQAPLEKGKNLLTIPLIASKGGNGILKTQVIINNEKQTFYVHLYSPT